MCSVAPFNRYASNVLCSTEFVWLADEVAKPDDRSASAKLTTGLQTLHSGKPHARRTPRVSLVQASLARKKHIAQVHAGKRSGKPNKILLCTTLCEAILMFMDVYYF